MNRLLLIPLVLFLACEDKQEKDCAGVEGGAATVDECGLCTGGTTGLLPNYLMDCSGECGGIVLIDSCGVCDGDNNSCRGCTNIYASNYDSLTTIDDGSCLFTDDAHYGCYDGYDNDGDGLTDFEDPNCQGYFNGQNLTDLNNMELEIKILLGDGTCENSSFCNLFFLTTGCCDSGQTFIPYCETDINNNIIDSLSDSYSILFSTLFECVQYTPCSDQPWPFVVHNNCECQLAWDLPEPPPLFNLSSPPENCEDCIDNDNDGFIDYGDSECPEEIIEGCLSDSVSVCSNLIVQWCEDYFSEAFSGCQSALESCIESCYGAAEAAGYDGAPEQCIEDCETAYQACATAVEEVMGFSAEECITLGYQACIPEIEEICFNTYCTCDSTASN